MDFESSPGYLQGADLHNVGSGNPSFFSDPIGQTEDFISAIPSFAVTSIASGINSIYNSSVVAGNFFGITDAKENDLQQTLGSYDTDLSKYYGAHKQLVDTAGFIGTSFLPGTAGVKLLQTGQRVLAGALEAGTVGRTLAETTGLITTIGKDGMTLGKMAGQALAEGQQAFTLTNAAVLKAIGAGVGSATLEAAAFETMVQATMFRSPVLEGQDFKDIASNIVTGGVLGGVIGGAFNAAKISGEIKTVISAADLKQKPFTLRSSQYALQNPADRIVVAAGDLAATPAAVSAAETALKSTRVTTINQEIRTNIHALSGGDKELGNIVADSLQGMSGEEVADAMHGARSISRPGTISGAGEGHTIGYVRLHGEDVGAGSFDQIPLSKLTLADTIPGGADKIMASVKSFAAGWKVKGDKGGLWTPVTSLGNSEIEARYIWAEKLAKYEDGMTIGHQDIPLLEGALRNKLSKVTVDDGVHSYTVSAENMANEIEQAKMALADELGKSQRAGWGFNAGAGNGKIASNVNTLTSDDIARAANISVKRLESDAGASMYARQDAQAAYDKMRADKGISQGESDLSFIPQHASVSYDTSTISAGGTDLTSALVNIKQAQKISQEAVDRAVAGVTGDVIAGRLVHPGDKAILNSNRYGAGAGLVTFANGAPGTLASWAENVGSAAAALASKLGKDTSNVLDTVALKLRSNQAAAIEFDKINNTVSGSAEKYVLNSSGDGLISKQLAEYEAKVRSGQKGLTRPILQEGAPESIAFTNPEVGDAIMARLETNGTRVTHNKNLKNAVGLTDDKDPSVYYPIKPNPKDYPFFAFVKDDTVTGAGMGHTSMLHAASQADLDAMIKMAREKTSYSVYTKADAENFYKAQQSYEWDRTLHDNYMDAGLKSAGINTQFFPKTDPSKIVDQWLETERRADSVLTRDTISAKFGHEFDQLETLGQQYTNVASSRYGVSAKSIEGTVKNPYNDYRKTALNISRLSEFPLLTAFNRNLESAVGSVFSKVEDAWNSVKSVEDLQTVNDALKAAGIEHAYKNAAEVLLANHSAPKPYLSNFIRGANSILSNTFLRYDPLNALNNSLGAQVLLGHETSGQVRALLRGLDQAGVTVPGTTDTILSTSKLISKANGNYWDMLQGNAPELKEMYKRNGWTTRLMDQHKSMLDDLTLSGSETPSLLNNKLSSAMKTAKALGEKGEVWTGNKLAEEYNRFVAADVARQISDLHISSGLMPQEGQAAFINTFVNRTQGNALASQRPLIFQGPIGQAVGLFQTFQFNTMQQLFRGISEGGTKDAAMMMGLQGTMYGMNGLPGFQYINQHIIGTASGNPNHTDAYSTLYGAAGKTAGDWLMYGVPSNLLQTNIYSRGDINPRTLTVIPVNPQDIVAVSAFGKFAGNLKETVGKIAGGGDILQSVLQGIEKNGLFRPLAGLAQTMQAAFNPTHQVYSTTNQGDISFVNDFMSLATMSRLAGGKPLDEAIANDEVARSTVYKAASKLTMKAATETFKTTVIGDKNGSATPVAVNNYLDAFVRAGGTREAFNQQMLNTMTRVNTPRANQIISSLKGPYAEHMKGLMNGPVEELGQ
jgi:hypothetical protein